MIASPVVAELAEHRDDTRLPRNMPQRGRVEHRERVRVAGLRTGDDAVVVDGVDDVPPENDVAEAEPLLQGRLELGERHVLATQHAVDVEAADLDVTDAL